MHRRLLLLTLCAVTLALGLMPVWTSLHPQIRPLLMDALHIPAGALVGFCAWRLTRAGGHQFWRAAGWSALAFFLLELVQPLFNRTFGLRDLAYSLIGILIGAGWAACIGKHARRSVILLVLLPLLTLYASLPAVRASQQWLASVQKMPVLGTFDQSTLNFGWRPVSDEILMLLEHNPNARLGTMGNPGFLKVRTGSSEWSGVVLRPARADWASYQRLCFSSRGDGNTGTLVVRLDRETWSSAANSAMLHFPITRTWEQRCIDLTELRTHDGSRLGRDQIRQLAFLIDTRTSARTFHLDDVRLVP